MDDHEEINTMLGSWEKPKNGIESLVRGMQRKMERSDHGDSRTLNKGKEIEWLKNYRGLDKSGYRTKGLTDKQLIEIKKNCFL